MSVRKIAVIDLGTNTFHLVLASIEKNSFHIYLRERASVRIGKGGISKKVITEDAQERALKALNNFRAIIDRENIEEVYATATSAFRNASNGKDLVARIRKETGISINIIDGNQEAEYIFYGVSESMAIGNENVLVMDIGGGSVEFIIGQGHTMLWKQSFEVGAQRLLDQFVTHDPLTTQELKNLNGYFQKELEPLQKAIATYQPKVLIGASGTFDTLSDIYQYQIGTITPPNATEYPITMECYTGIYSDIVHKNREERLAIPGMIEMRVDMIVVACALLDYVLNSFHIQDIRISAYALKEGVLAKIAASH